VEFQARAPTDAGAVDLGVNHWKIYFKYLYYTVTTILCRWLFR